jgi:hypothetical protein
MKLTRLIAVLVGLLSLTGVLAGTASPTTVGACQLQLEAMQANTLAAESSFTNPKDFNGLRAKLEAASTKLAEGKNADAVEKLTDYRDTLALLATAPKPKVVPAVALEPETGLVAKAQGVIDCINKIGTA